MEPFVSRAAHLADSVSNARSRRTLLAALGDFERMLAAARDYPRGFLTENDLAALQAIADIVIDEIEHRLDSGADRPAVQRDLASRIYHIRAELESIYVRLHRDKTGDPACDVVPPVSLPRVR